MLTPQVQVKPQARDGLSVMGTLQLYLSVILLLNKPITLPIPFFLHPPSSLSITQLSSSYSP